MKDKMVIVLAVMLLAICAVEYMELGNRDQQIWTLKMQLTQAANFAQHLKLQLETCKEKP